MGGVALVQCPTGGSVASRRPRAHFYLRLPAFLWALAFASVHVYWLLGGRSAIPSDIAITPGSAIFYAALAALPLLIIAGLIALRGEHWVGTTTALYLLLLVLEFCLVHSTYPLARAAVMLSNGGALWSSERSLYALVYEINWFAGGVWFALAIAGLVLSTRQKEHPSRP